MCELLKLAFQDSSVVSSLALQSTQPQKIIIYDRSKAFKRGTINIGTLSLVIVDYGSKANDKSVRWLILDYHKSDTIKGNFWIDVDDEPREIGARIFFSSANGHYKIVRTEFTQTE